VIELKGDFWMEAENDYDAIVCTINTRLRKDGTLVMGAGIAKEFAENFLYLPDTWGRRTKEMLKTCPFVELREHPCLVGLHTKYDWKDDSPLHLIDRSLKQLHVVAQSLNWTRILMTKPGCGHGGRSWGDEVKPLFDKFDHRYYVIDN